MLTPSVRTLSHLISLYKSNYKDQLSLTNPRDALHHGERPVNKDGFIIIIIIIMQTNNVDTQCDELATELS